jgi:DNA-directed RNA polymerase subunit RPC12/RpoP
MDKKFHINSNGDVKVCAATKNACQFGDGSLHFTDPEAARKVAEEILSKAEGDSKVLSGKKKSRLDLEFKATLGKASFKEAMAGLPDVLPAEKVPVKAAQKFEARESAYIKQIAGNTHREVYIESAPREIQRLFKRALSSGDELRTLLRDSVGNYRGISYSKVEDKFSTWNAPATKDVPLTMGVVGGWNMSLHPNGPKIMFQCSQCNARGQERLGNFPHRQQGDFRIRCRYCGQMGTVPLQYS